MPDASEPLRFRCHGCGQSLGVTPAKAGRRTRCPKCRVELIVPGLEHASGTDPYPVLTGDAPSPEPITTLFELSELRPEDVRVLAGSDVDFLRQAEGANDFAPIEPDSTPWQPPVEPILRAKVPPPPLPRGRDLVLPRSVVLAWMLLALMAVACAFLAGFLVGKVGLPAVAIRKATPKVVKTAPANL